MVAPPHSSGLFADGGPVAGRRNRCGPLYLHPVLIFRGCKSLHGIAVREDAAPGRITANTARIAATFHRVKKTRNPQS